MLSKSVLVVAFFATSIATSLGSVGKDAGIDSFRDADSSRKQRLQLAFPQLRSAALLRATGRQIRLQPSTAAQRRHELQRHFNVVLQILEANMEDSIRIALDRLEDFRQEDWTVAQRQHWSNSLRDSRVAQIIRLDLYRMRGRFPQNEHHAQLAIPIFVDHYGTACAVGHLMRESGWQQVVDTIERENNLVYVPDIKTGPVVHWIVYSGLTQEEAAMIQPIYDPPPADATLDQLLQAGESLSHGGLRYENFSIHEDTSCPFGPLFCSPGVYAGDPSLIGVSLHDTHFLTNTIEPIDPFYDDWMFFGSLGFEGIKRVGHNEATTVIYEYDVVAELPSQQIIAAAIDTEPLFNFNFSGEDGRILINSFIYRSGLATPIAQVQLDSDINLDFDFFRGHDSESFAPQSQIHVQTFVHLAGGTSGFRETQFTSLLHSFNVIPEPTSLALCFAVVAIWLTVRRATKT